MHSTLKNKRKFISYNKNLTQKARENRKNPTKAEKKIWYEVLRNKDFENYKFIRQKPLDNFIVDFYCSELLLVIEIDGDSHSEQIDYDISRTKKLNQFGIKIIRYTNFEILRNIKGVYDDLKIRIRERREELNFVESEIESKNEIATKTHPNPPRSASLRAGSYQGGS